MAKRPCPFEENCAPQVKVHVTNEDVNSQDPEYMASVYERTVQRLFDGSNRVDNKSNVNSTANPPQAPAQVPQQTVCAECQTPRNIFARCWFCEISLCSNCFNVCNYCYEKFCSRCSVAIYRNGNNFTCLTCYN